jgi:hypothetical protein
MINEKRKQEWRRKNLDADQVGFSIGREGGDVKSKIWMRPKKFGGLKLRFWIIRKVKVSLHAGMMDQKVIEWRKDEFGEVFQVVAGDLLIQDIENSFEVWNEGRSRVALIRDVKCCKEKFYNIIGDVRVGRSRGLGKTLTEKVVKVIVAFLSPQIKAFGPIDFKLVGRQGRNLLRPLRRSSLKASHEHVNVRRQRKDLTGL